MTQEGTVVTIQENFPDDLQFMTDGVGPDQTPIPVQSINLSRARVWEEGAARIVADRVRDWYDENMPNHEVEVEVREVEYRMKEK